VGLEDLAAYAEAPPLTPEQIIERTFHAAKHGVDATVSLEDLVAFTSEDPELILETDDKGWTPLLWASFHGQWQVGGVVAPATTSVRTAQFFPSPAPGVVSPGCGTAKPPDACRGCLWLRWW
jgi:hypothetical protein